MTAPLKYRILPVTCRTLLALLAFGVFILPGRLADTFHPMRLTAKTEWAADRPIERKYTAISDEPGVPYIPFHSESGTAKTVVLNPATAIREPNHLVRVALAAMFLAAGREGPRIHHHLPRNAVRDGSDDDSSHHIQG